MVVGLGGGEVEQLHNTDGVCHLTLLFIRGRRDERSIFCWMGREQELDSNCAGEKDETVDSDSICP
uniref:Uncharacterized protein n=1 Tax=Oryza punctata TaxID=4537 RepID=A0A0E0KGF9_ORYPU